MAEVWISVECYSFIFARTASKHFNKTPGDRRNEKRLAQAAKVEPEHIDKTLRFALIRLAHFQEYNKKQYRKIKNQ